MVLLYNDIVILSIGGLNSDNGIYLSVIYIDIGIYLWYNWGIIEDSIPYISNTHGTKRRGRNGYIKGPAESNGKV